MATTTNHVNAPIDEVLNETEIGGWIAKNKSASIAIVVLLIAGVLGFGFYNHFSTKKANETADRLYQFETVELTKLSKNEIDHSTVITSWNSLKKSISGDIVALTELSLVSQLIEKDKLSDALTILESGVTQYSNNQILYFYRTQLASIYEDMNQEAKAVEQLKKVVTSNVKYLEAKVYVDLGRLHLSLGQTSEAKTHFEYVVNKLKDAEFIRIAKLYLSEMN